MKRICLVLGLVLLLCGCAREVSTQYYMMDTVMTFQVYGAQALAAEREIFDRIAQLENILSPTREGSELMAVNRLAGQPVQVSEDLAALLRLSLQANEETDGAFDPTLGGVIELWQKQVVPSEASLANQTVGIEHVMLSDDVLQVAAGMKLNFGAVAKGYASDCAKEILERREIPRALISLGGNVYAKGEKEDGSPWLVGVRDPNGTQEEWLGLVQASDKFLIASGDYERYFEEGGVRYHHILDPETRAPAQTDLREVVIVSDSGSRGDILSTALFVMGSDGAVEYWRAHRDFEVILVREDNTVLVSAGLSDAFVLTSEEYRVEVIE